MNTDTDTHGPALTALTADQAIDFFGGKPIAGGTVRLNTARALALLETAMITDAVPSALPTLAEVQRFAEYWHEQIKAIDASANAAFQIYRGNLGITFYAYSNGATGDGPTPEQAIQSLSGKIGPAGRQARIAKLRAEADALEKEAGV
jgi:hypothetical protein